MSKTKNRVAEAKERGILFSSGLIAGEGLVGILMAVFAILKINIALQKGEFLFDHAASVLFFILLCVALLVVSFYKKINFLFRRNE